MLHQTKMELHRNTINLRDVTFSPLSLVDDFGQVFFSQGKIFRGIQKGQKDTCLDFLNSDLFKKLEQENLLVKTWISELCNERYDLILEHELLQESKPHHWSFNMYKDVALLILRVNEVCNKFGYELKDAHPYNVLFKDNQPIFVDFGSIVKINSNSKRWASYSQFIDYNYLQLLIWSKGDYFTARKLIEDGNSPVARTIPMSSLLDSSFVKPYEKQIYDRVALNAIKNKIIVSTAKGINSIVKLFFKKDLRRLYRNELKPYNEIKQSLIHLQKSSNNTRWKNYHDSYRHEEKIISTPRFDRIIALIKTHTPDINTSIDLAGNQGVFSRILCDQLPLNKLLLTDYDENAIDIAYLSLRNEHKPIIPFLYNFMLPLRDEESKSLKSDIAFALAITHHLILSQKYALNTIFRRIAAHSKKYVAIEFMPLGLWDGSGTPEIPSRYNVEWFRNEFLEHFQLLYEEQLEPNRIFFLGKK